MEISAQSRSILKVHEKMSQVRFSVPGMPYGIDQRSRSMQVDVVPPDRSEEIAIERHCQLSGTDSAGRHDLVIKEHLGPRIVEIRGVCDLRPRGQWRRYRINALYVNLARPRVGHRRVHDGFKRRFSRPRTAAESRLRPHPMVGLGFFPRSYCFG